MAAEELTKRGRGGIQVRRLTRSHSPLGGHESRAEVALREFLSMFAPCPDSASDHRHDQD
jgi:hypothetical protein